MSILRVGTVDGKKVFILKDKFFGKTQGQNCIAKFDEDIEKANALVVDLKKDVVLNLSETGQRILSATVSNIEQEIFNKDDLKNDLERLMFEVDDDVEIIEE